MDIRECISKCEPLVGFRSLNNTVDYWGSLPRKVGDSDGNEKLPLGIENFEEIRTEDFYYIDKSMLIADLLNGWGKVNLFTRPRRFGKP